MSPRRRAVRNPSETTIFAQMTALAAQNGAVNLGQGFPDSDGPNAVLEAAITALRDGANQYPPGRGTPDLLQAISEHQESWYGLSFDPTNQILVTMGATEAIAASILALVEPGDEVVMFEPYYDSYAAMVDMAGGRRVTVPLRFPDFEFDVDALARVITPRTTMLILNTPHNPTGKVFTTEELQAVSGIANQHDLLVLSDEVYEHLAFSPAQHVPAASIPGLTERTLTFGSGGKTFNTTGWKIGWASGPVDLISLVAGAKQFLTFAGGTPLQSGIAAGLKLPGVFFEELQESMAQRRDLLAAGLTEAGLKVSSPEGGYFVLADAAPLGVRDARRFALDLPQTAGVVGVPTSVFCDDAEATGLSTVMRFAFCKRPETIKAATERLINTFAG